MELPRRPIQIAAGALLASAFVTMVLGAFVKAIGGGMACPEWPTCIEGQAWPEFSTLGIAAEMTHRVSASLVILSGIALLYLEFTQYRSERGLLGLTAIAGGLVGLQVVLGALTIFYNLHPVIVTSHLAVATLIFGFTLVIAQRVWKLPPPKASEAVAPTPAPEGAEPG